MSRFNRILILVLFTGIALLVLAMMPPIKQAAAYHRFADNRLFLGIPNFANVVSNVGFVFTGLIGLFLVWRSSANRNIRVIYYFLFFGVFLTGVGSGYYHWRPDNNTLVWDRLPMTLVFMSLTSATMSEVFGIKVGIRFLFPLLLLGTFSVWYWHETEMRGNGDLRPYLLVQFYPVIFIPMLLGLFYNPKLRWLVTCFLRVVVWYVIAKIFEQFDFVVFATYLVSGHTLKHIAASVSTWYLVVMFREGHYLIRAVGVRRKR